MYTQQQAKYLQVINTIGIKKVQQLYAILGARPVSMATIKKAFFKMQLHESLKKNGQVTRVAKQLKISRMTIYRQLKIK
jgi:transcriptional regulator of acetoin/glycerol metabolism